MHAATLVLVHAAEEASEGSQTSPWLFGFAALAVLVVALIATMMIKVER